MTESSRPDPSQEPPKPGPDRIFPRIVDSVGPRSRRSPTVEIIGRRKAGFDDLYHKLLTASWGQFLGLAAVAYLAMNFVFALLFWLDGDGVAGMARHSLLDAFFFSVQTFGTIGYGVMAPRDTYINLVVTLESFVSLGAVAVSTGLIFARVSRPTARVLFSERAVITNFEGVPTLIFRCANERANQILDAEVTVSAAKQVVTAEGLVVRRMLDMKVTRSRSPLFALTWMVLHPIDEQSPLYGATPESLIADKVEIIIVLAGVDETFAQRIHARHSFIPPEIVWNRQFADVLYVSDDGRRVVDYSKFHLLDDEVAEQPREPGADGRPTKAN